MFTSLNGGANNILALNTPRSFSLNLGKMTYSLCGLIINFENKKFIPSNEQNTLTAMIRAFQ